MATQPDEVPSLQKPRKRLNLSWVYKILIHPGATFELIIKQSGNVWITPLVTISLTILLVTFASGYINQRQLDISGPQLPPGFEFYSPEQQAQFMQAFQATQGPVFIYVLPAMASLTLFWLSWLIVGGIMHLVLTLLGGRGDTRISMNIVAWSGIPFAVKYIIQFIYIIFTQTTIASQGLSGLITITEDSRFSLYLAELLALIDIYLLWNCVLLIIGTSLATRISKWKSFLGVCISVIPLLLIRALLGYLPAQFSEMTIIRPFLF